MLTRSKHVSMCGWRRTIWVVFAASPGYQISHPTMLLDATPRPFSPSVVHVIVGVAVYYQLTFFFFLSFPEKSRFVPLFFFYFNFNSYSFYFYFFFFTYRSFICFQFSPSIPIWHILSFPARSLLFWFVILFLWPFCEFFFQFIHQL